jgi:hypothetical protein
MNALYVVALYVIDERNPPILLLPIKYSAMLSACFFFALHDKKAPKANQAKMEYIKTEALI